MYKTKFTKKEFDQARQLLVSLNNGIKNLIPDNLRMENFETAGHSETGVGFIDGKAIERVILILRGCGCAWTQQEEGGCTMCGHYSGSSKGKFIPAESLKKQFDTEMARYDFRKYPMLCLYNGGSFLNEEEIDKNLRRYMLKTINDNPHIKRLIIESRTDFLTNEALDEIEELMTDTVVEIGVGLESVCDVIRSLLLNKGVSTWDLVSIGEKFRGRKIKLLAYVLVNPPFLTEAEAIEDTVMTIEFAKEMGASIVSLEAVSIQHLTMVSFLAEAGFYKTPWIWSMFEIIRRIGALKIETRLGGFEFFPIPKEFTSNCSTCNAEMLERIHQYNKINDMNIIHDLMCPNRCDLTWREELKRVDHRNLPQRVIETLSNIDIPATLERLRASIPGTN